MIKFRLETYATIVFCVSNRIQTVFYPSPLELGTNLIKEMMLLRTF